MSGMRATIFLGIFQNHNKLPVYGVILAAFTLTACVSSDRETVVEKAVRGNFVASVTKSNLHATTPISYSVTIYDEANRRHLEILRAAHLDSISVEWSANRRLVISMPCGRIYHYVNAFDIIDVDDKIFSGTIEIVLNNSGLCEKWLQKRERGTGTQ